VQTVDDGVEIPKDAALDTTTTTTTTTTRRAAALIGSVPNRRSALTPREVSTLRISEG
jgi:hypothetical protein